MHAFCGSHAKAPKWFSKSVHRAIEEEYAWPNNKESILYRTRTKDGNFNSSKIAALIQLWGIEGEPRKVGEEWRSNITGRVHDEHIQHTAQWWRLNDSRQFIFLSENIIKSFGRTGANGRESDKSSSGKKIKRKKKWWPRPLSHSTGAAVAATSPLLSNAMTQAKCNNKNR